MSKFGSVGVLVVFLITGCSTYGVPSLNHGIINRTSPDVKDLVTHVNCELARAMLVPPTDSWRHLWQENLVASADFTLLAANTEGFNASVNWIVPTNSLGKEVFFPPQASGTTGMSSMFNRGLAIGIQANGTQDRIPMCGVWQPLPACAPIEYQRLGHGVRAPIVPSVA